MCTARTRRKKEKEILSSEKTVKPKQFCPKFQKESAQPEQEGEKNGSMSSNNTEEIRSTQLDE